MRERTEEWCLPGIPSPPQSTNFNVSSWTLLDGETLQMYFYDFLRRLMVTRQELHINPGDEVFQRVQSFWEELRAQCIWGSLTSLNPSLTPVQRPTEAEWERTGVKEIIQTDEGDAWLPLPLSSLPFLVFLTHTLTSYSSLYFDYSVQPRSTVSLPPSLAAAQLLCHHLSSLCLRKEQAD